MQSNKLKEGSVLLHIQEDLEHYSREYETNEEQLKASLLGLSEYGELINDIRKYLYQGHPRDLEKYVEELSDGLFYTNQVASALGVGMDLVVAMLYVKIKRRYPSGSFSPEESASRTKAEPGELWTEALKFLNSEEFPEGDHVHHSASIPEPLVRKLPGQRMQRIHEYVGHIQVARDFISKSPEHQKVVETFDSTLGEIMTKGTTLSELDRMLDVEMSSQDKPNSVKTVRTTKPTSTKTVRQQRILKNVCTALVPDIKQPCALKDLKLEKVHGKNRDAFLKMRNLRSSLQNLYDLIQLPIEGLVEYHGELCKSGPTQEENAVFLLEKVYDVTWYRWMEMIMLNAKQAVLERQRMNQYATGQLSFDYIDDINRIEVSE